MDDHGMIKDKIVRGWLNPLSILLFFLLAAAVPPPAATAGRPSADEIISLNVKDRPLGEVLGSITKSTGREFLLDDGWRAYPVTTVIEETPLHVGLKRVLSGLNHAIVYRSDGRIRILIYETAPAGRSAQNRPGAGSTFAPQPSASVRQPPRPPSAPGSSLPEFQPFGGPPGSGPGPIPDPRGAPENPPAAGETVD
jgi:hypothetical protein